MMGYLEKKFRSECVYNSYSMALHFNKRSSCTNILFDSIHANCFFVPLQTSYNVSYLFFTCRRATGIFHQIRSTSVTRVVNRLLQDEKIRRVQPNSYEATAFLEVLHPGFTAEAYCNLDATLKEETKIQ